VNWLAPLALAALIPGAIGPLPQEERALVLSLCLGGEITIPLDGDDEGHGHDCHQIGCHAGGCREKVKPIKSI